MRDKGFDQLPVKSSASPTTSRLVGLVTLGNLLSWIGSGRCSPDSPASEAMFDFSKISEVIGDPNDITDSSAKVANALKDDDYGSGGEKHRRKEFVEITMDTPLTRLSRFFEWNSAAVVTQRSSSGELQPQAVVTKVDLLTYLVRQSKMNGHS